MTTVKKVKKVVHRRNKVIEQFDKNKLALSIYQYLDSNFNNSKEVNKLLAEQLADEIEKQLENLYDDDVAIIPSDVINKLKQKILNSTQFHILKSSSKTSELRNKDLKYFKQPHQYFQFLTKFARFNEAAGRRETWDEAIDRVISFFRSYDHLKVFDNFNLNNLCHKVINKIKNNNSVYSKIMLDNEKLKFVDDSWETLRYYMLNMAAFPALRVLQLAGPALKRCNVGVYNCCAIPIDSIDSFCELLYILMQGTGAGFSVEKDVVDKLPTVSPYKEIPNKPIPVVVIEDSTEGWCKALEIGLKAWFNGKDVKFDFSKIRPKGTILKTKGGTASGPEPLMRLLNFARSTILAASGRKLKPIEVHDICCMIGEIVRVGGVRRAALISLSSFDDIEMRQAKLGNWYINHPYRARANNSAVYEKKPSSIEFMKEWLDLAEGGSGERGIFNRQATILTMPQRREPFITLTNPCAEIILRPYQFCNLSTAVFRADDSIESFIKKIIVATIFGTMQATLTNFNYLRPIWKKTTEKEYLLGVDITGQADAGLIRAFKHQQEVFPGITLPVLFNFLKEIVIETNKILAELFNIKPAAAATCVKPSGDSSQLFECSSGVHPRYSKYYIRRFLIDRKDPVAKLLTAAGVPYVEMPDNSDLISFEFPVKSPDNSTVVEDVTAIDMLEYWLLVKKHWAEHSVSCTIYVDSDSWFKVGNWVYEHFDEISGLSFFPKDLGIYKATPYEAITEEEYERLIKNFPKIDWGVLDMMDNQQYVSLYGTFSCVASQCEL